jgi:hypothetical protein
MTSTVTNRLPRISKEANIVSEDPQPINNGTQQEETPARQEVDVILDVRELEVDRIKLTVKDLRAHVSVLAELASLLNLQVGVNARLDEVELEGPRENSAMRWRVIQEVAFAEQSEADFNDALPYIPDDPDFSQLWDLRNAGQTVNGTTGTANADIDASEAWELVKGHPDVIDTGADLDHPDLHVNLLPRGTEDWDFADANDPSPDDNDSH